MKASLRNIALVAALGVIVSLSLFVRAQESSPSPIVVRGKVLSLQMESNESWRLKYNAEVELRFINVSNHSVIIPKRDSIWVESVYGKRDKDEELTFSGSETEQVLQYSEINHSSPPANKLVVLAPGDSYTTHSTIPLDFDRDDIAGGHVFPKSLHANLELTLNSWVPVYLTRTEENEMDELLNNQEMFEYFKNKWSAYGELIIGEIEAEPIDIQLPPEPPAPRPTGLVLRGTVTSVGPKQESKDYISFDIGLHLEFVNNGKKPVILLKPEHTGYSHGYNFMFGIDIPDSSDQSAPRFLNGGWGPSCAGRSPENDSARAAMDQPNPPEDQFWIVPPRNSIALPLNVTINVPRTQTSYFGTNVTWPEISGIRDFSMRVSLQVWPTTWIEPSCGGTDNPVFGRKLRDQWSKFGTLEMGEGGMMSSEPIPLTLPTE